MNANKFATGITLSLTLCAVATAAWATQGLDSRSQTKVNNAMAKAWQKGGNSQNDPALQKQVVNIGSRRNNTCNVNVGTAKPGEKAPKEIVVTTKEVINVCK
ncbi:hypothetical protein B9N43_13645 [Denitratisoma sp. DHT3]|uniref:hypothetical protein n=1 Tax=Denitratisoma sp. DHT3 TaxID=1981880 RepID=UPI001198B0D1|nr:hypothetical protein [Denitratisoma sp. DHT3]QDX82197.1 hypothetical protein B9N43_13645 [Denitratisoma sp. DHT3]